jgi:hypothetical protein
MICMVVRIECLRRYINTKFHYVDMNNLENVQSLINENTKMVG